MDITNAQRAEILTQALPYIQEYRNKIIVVKYGGNAMISEELKEAVIGDLVLLSLIGIKVVLVHGGGPEINDLLKKTGKKPEFIDGLRVTDEETIEAVQMVLAGKINKNLVNKIENMGGKALGLCGIDGHMIKAKKLDDVHGFVGEITDVNTDIITDLLEKDYIPVISTIAYDNQNNSYNINADTAAAFIAGALKAESLINMRDKLLEEEVLVRPIANIEIAHILTTSAWTNSGSIRHNDNHLNSLTRSNHLICNSWLLTSAITIPRLVVSPRTVKQI